jgi:hypothetical protein
MNSDASIANKRGQSIDRSNDKYSIYTHILFHFAAVASFLFPSLPATALAHAEKPIDCRPAPLILHNHHGRVTGSGDGSLIIVAPYSDFDRCIYIHEKSKKVWRAFVAPASFRFESVNFVGGSNQIAAHLRSEDRSWESQVIIFESNSNVLKRIYISGPVVTDITVDPTGESVFGNVKEFTYEGKADPKQPSSGARIYEFKLDKCNTVCWITNDQNFTPFSNIFYNDQGRLYSLGKDYILTGNHFPAKPLGRSNFHIRLDIGHMANWDTKYGNSRAYIAKRDDEQSIDTPPLLLGAPEDRGFDPIGTVEGGRFAVVSGDGDLIRVEIAQSRPKDIIQYGWSINLPTIDAYGVGFDGRLMTVKCISRSLCNLLSQARPSSLPASAIVLGIISDAQVIKLGAEK